MAQINIEISKGGATKIEVKGHKGPGCTKLTKAIEEALGTVTSDVKTGEYCLVGKQGQQAKASQ